MKYKVYLKGNQCTPFFKGNRCIWDMYTKPSGGNPTIDDGGDINLPNGDVLHINQKMGPCGWGDDYEGIQVSLESGNEAITYFYMINNDQFQESGFGCLYDYDEEDMYAEGNFFRIYDLQGDSYYDHQEAFWSEDALAGYTFYVVVIREGEWVLIDNADPMYYGSTVTLNSGEDIWVSGISGCDGTGIYFTRSSGGGCYAYLKYDGDLINESSNYWFGLNGYSLDNDFFTITIYDYGSDDYDSAIDDTYDYDESNVENYLSVMCILRYNPNTNAWEIEEDNT